MNSDVSPRNGTTPSSVAADSSSRSVVVPDRDDAGGAADRRGRILAHLAALRVHAVRVRLAAHRQEGAGADMQRHGRPAHACLVERRQQRGA